MPVEVGIFDILERRDKRGSWPLNENHWSNALAWLLDRNERGEVSLPLLKAIASQTSFHLPNELEWEVERERQYSVEDRRPKIDIELSFRDGRRLLIENKIDPSYQNQQQIIDESSLLGAHDQLLVIAPNDLTSFVSSTLHDHPSREKTSCMSWRTVAEICQTVHDESPSASLTATVILNGISKYWMSQSSDAFEQMLLTIINEQGWSTFYPDDFKDVFEVRYPNVWNQWVEQRGETGIGNAKWYLTTLLRGLARRKTRVVELTGEDREPKDPKWGFSPIYEYRVRQEGEQ